MVRPRGSSARTKAEILRVARELLAREGIDAVSVRRIAVAADVDHALVHQYFGTREQLVEAIVRAEVEAASRLLAPGTDVGDPLERMRAALRYFLTDGRATVLLITRAELAGLTPEAMLAPGAARALRLMADELAARQAETPGSHPDPALLAATAGAALFGFAALAPWLMDAVNLTLADYDARLDEIVDLVVGLVAGAKV